MKNTSILLPHTKNKNSFYEFGGDFRGRLVDDLDTYSTYIYWVYGIPGTNVECGWYSRIPSTEYISLWYDHIKTYDKPELFSGEYRKCFGYDTAYKKFSKALSVYYK